MRAIKMLAGLGLAAAISSAPVGAATVEEVIAKHIEARGGARWNEIETIRIEGSYTAVSQVNPFTIRRKRDRRYRMDTTMIGAPSTTGYDGETLWNNGRRGLSAIEGLDRSIFLRDVDFATPFFDYRERGFEVKLLGTVDFEGMDAIGIELTRPDDGEETWFLDPATYLEMGRVSPGNDWLGPVERRTYYEDFREVDGVMIPFLTEAQWYTRHRLLEVDRVETNLAVDDELFVMPPPEGMGPLAALVGSWRVTAAERRQPDADWEESELSSTIEASMRGAMLQEEFTRSTGTPVVRTFSYDRFNERYRITQIDGRRNQLDVREGNFDDEGRLIASNVETGTSFSSRGTTYHGRLSIFDITDEGFKAEYETSTDGGETWFVAAKATYSRNDG